MPMTRRYVLYVGGVGAMALFIPRCRAILSKLLFRPRGEEVVPKAFKRATPGQRKSLIAIVKGDDVEAMIREGIGLLGGLERFDLKGKQALLKPNVVAADPPPTTTDPRVVKAVVNLLYQAGASKVVIGEMSAILTLPTMRNLERTGIKQAALEAGAEVTPFDDGEWVLVNPPQARYVKSFYVAKAYYEADFLVSLPVIKTHRSASYSLSLKNTIGAIHPRNRPSLYGSQYWEEIIAEVNLAAIPHLIIADGLRCMVAGGPWHGEAERTNLIMASWDMIALDAVGLSLLKHFGRWDRVTNIPVWEQRQVRRAVELGLGAKGPFEVELIAKSLSGKDEAFSKLAEAIEVHLRSGAEEG